MKNSFNYKQTAKIMGLLLTGLFLGWLFFGGSTADQPATMDEHVEEAHTDERGNIVYTCSMHPGVRQSEPGNCPICGMELIPVSADPSSDEDNPYEFTMSKAAMKLAEVQTTRVISDVATDIIRLPGKIMVDERRIRTLPAHFPGRIEHLYVNFTGEYIAKGEKVASLYSPALISAQKELLETARFKEQNPSLYRASKAKLLNWKIPESRINEIETSGEVKTQFDITSDTNGYVIKKNISMGDHVETGTVMYQMADLSKVWVTFNAYENDLASLKVGDRVSFTVDAYPGEKFQARITYIDPILDPQSRTAKVRAEAGNPNAKLKPQMLAEGVISSKVADGQKVLQVPKTAVLWTGERSVVYVKKADTERPSFEFREVVLGRRVGDNFIIKSGLQAGEEVVTHGNFKIDSAAQLAGKASMMNRDPDGTKPATHDHSKIQEGADTQVKPDINKGASKKDTLNHQHTEHLSALLMHYLDITSSLAGDRLQEAKSHLESFRREAVQNSEMKEHTEHSAMHEKQHAAMLQALEQASGAENISQFRTYFSHITDNLVKAINNRQFDQMELYLQYCPMALDGKGANWLSDTQKINNPYMGQKMPGCGEMKQQISTDS